ncbi:MAG: D-Ala-D-Ala carboxypeptidase family metallohydrolase [Verrucomicrobiota bacterium JB023]|nr:D-Ala-D-Ala carboxypeptidase family metallohydrolase [Verrucomicrobiota bacterium JB023]
MAGIQESSAFLFFGGKTNLNTDDLPQEWVRSQGERLQAYARHIASLKLEKISVHEVIKAHARRKGSVWNQIPPKKYWQNMDSTLLVADKVTEVLGVSLDQVTSAYRCPAYNSRCPGAKPRSYHMQNVALDLMFNTSTSRVSRVARELRNNGLFKGGVGRYSNFTHIDTRGYNADW